MRKYLLACAFAILNFFISFDALSCMYLPKGHVDRVTEGQKEVFLFHDGTFSHMVIRMRLNAKKFPKEMGWLLPLSALPTKYEEINGPVFEELGTIFQKPGGSLLGSKFGNSGESAGGGKGSQIKIHTPVAVGQFHIQPIEVIDENGGAELTKWLVKNKFETPSFENQDYYFKKGAAFLAIKMQMNSPNSTDLLSRPLHIVYPSDKLSVPLKFFFHQGKTFDLSLYLFSKKKLSPDLKPKYFAEAKTEKYKSERLFPFVDDLIGHRSGYMTYYQGEDLNGAGKSLKELPSDPTYSKSQL